MSKVLWTPSNEQIKNANLTKYMNFLSEEYNLKFKNYDELWKWSVKNREDFWSSFWDFSGIIASKKWETILKNSNDMLESKWFQGARLNYAENLLKYRDEKTALIFKGEAQNAIKITYDELYNKVSRLQKSMKDYGIGIGDRVVGFMPNMIETVVAMLATSSLGAIWSSCSPDFGIKGVLDRFGQIEPKILFTANGYSYKSKKIDSLSKISGILKELPTIEKVVVVPYTESEPDISEIPNSIHYKDFISNQSSEMTFEQLPFDHPLYILYTSGTTGVPKCMVHGQGGTLIQHLKELVLHTNLTRDDSIFYYTTCGWMMWNWLISSLAVGSIVILFDGNPFYPDAGALFKLAENEAMTVFGTSAKYIAEIEKVGLKPSENLDLSKLRAILSTGSALSEESFEYVYRNIKKDLMLASISGGSDIISCFALGNPILPVHSGELQSRGLGINVDVFDLKGNSIKFEKGELVCESSFPSQPIYFWKDDGKEKYKKAYFDVFPNIWLHGDFAEITKNNGLIIYGRSDATLNPGGVRIGTAEIYRVVETFDEIIDSIVVGQDWDNDIRVILFVKMRKEIELTDELIKNLRTSIRKNCTPRHVPNKILTILDIPYTISGKKVEIAVRKIIENQPVFNRDALSNPESLDLYKDIIELQS